MHRDDLLSHVRIHARLYGRNHARRVVQAVVQELRSFVPAGDFDALAGQLPADVQPAPGPVRAGPETGPGSAHRLIRAVAARLHIAEPDAAFYARVTFEQLNAFCRGVSPARLAPGASADLRPLLNARVSDPADRHRDVFRTLGAAIDALSLQAPARAQATAPAEPAVAAHRVST